MSFGTQAQDLTWLFDGRGQRKYLCDSEARQFLRAAAASDRATQLLCLVIAYTGCRVSEALALTPRHLDMATKRLIFSTLKRRRIVHRAVPVPDHLMKALARFAKGVPRDERLWSWCRQTVWRRIRAIMATARIDGPMACGRGLRHGFGIKAASSKIPQNLIQRWMGHASPATTAIYLDAVGMEERAFAERMW
jgi:integrase/recombinase XerD